MEMEMAKELSVEDAVEAIMSDPEIARSLLDDLEREDEALDRLIEMGICGEEDEQANASDPKVWEAILEQMASIEEVPGVGVGEERIYPLPSYGWDGGNAIRSSQFGIEDICFADVFGGPGASLVRKAGKIGVAVHRYEGDNETALAIYR